MILLGESLRIIIKEEVSCCVNELSLRYVVEKDDDALFVLLCWKKQMECQLDYSAFIDGAQCVDSSIYFSLTIQEELLPIRR